MVKTIIKAKDLSIFWDSIQIYDMFAAKSNKYLVDFEQIIIALRILKDYVMGMFNVGAMRV